MPIFGGLAGECVSVESVDDVASFYEDHLFKQMGTKTAGPAKVDAQFMAIALSTY